MPSYSSILFKVDDLLKMMVDRYPDKILAVSQERYKVSDFKNAKLILELEKEKYTNENYTNHVEDITVNYFYVMYLLSKCESLFANCFCGGVDIANSFNQGKYVRNEIASVILNQ